MASSRKAAEAFAEAERRATEVARRLRKRDRFTQQATLDKIDAQRLVFSTVGRTDRAKWDRYCDKWFKAAVLSLAKCQVANALWPHDPDAPCPGDLGDTAHFTTILDLVLSGELEPESYTESQWRKLMGTLNSEKGS